MYGVHSIWVWLTRMSYISHKFDIATSLNKTQYSSLLQDGRPPAQLIQQRHRMTFLLFFFFLFSCRRIVAWGNVALTDWGYMAEADLCSFLPLPPPGRQMRHLWLQVASCILFFIWWKATTVVKKGLVKYYAFPVRNAWKLSKELVKINFLKKLAMWEEAFKHRKE